MEFVTAGPPRLELGAHVAGPFVLAQSDDIAVLVQAVRLHTTGLHLFIEWVRRRQRQNTESWKAQQDQLNEMILDYTDGPNGLLISAATGDEEHRPGQVLSAREDGGGGMASDDSRVSGWFQLWINPPDPHQAVHLTCSWIDFGLQPSSREVSRAEMSAAAAQIRELWPAKLERPGEGIF